MLRSDIAETMRNTDLCLRLIQRTARIAKKVVELALSVAALALRYVAWDRNSCAAKLRLEPKLFFARKQIRGFVNIGNEINRLLPRNQILITFHFTSVSTRLL